MSNRTVEVGFEKTWVFRFLQKKLLKNLKSPNFRFLTFFTYCVTNSIKMIFKYELGFVAFTWTNLCLLDLSLLFIVLLGRNFMSGICKLKPKKLNKPKTIFGFKNLGYFSSPIVKGCSQVEAEM